MKPPPATSPEALSRMKRQRQRDTGPEVLVRRILHRLGHRFRIHNRDLPGSPDIANRSRRWAVFVHGCYWHHHVGCPRATIPKKNRAFWLDKFMSNRARDAAKEQQLRDAGFQVVVVWECETNDPRPLERRLSDDLGGRV